MRRGSRWAGVGIGLATAIKLTPGIFIVYLLVTGRWRAAAVATGTAAAATLLAAALAPDASREFWTEALWNTDRVGSLSFISNQSLQGVVARLDPDDPSTLALARAGGRRRWRCGSCGAPGAAPATGDEATGLALTGIVGVPDQPGDLGAPPGLAAAGADPAGRQRGWRQPPGSRRRRWLLGLAVVAYALLISRFVWIWETGLHRDRWASSAATRTSGSASRCCWRCRRRLRGRRTARRIWRRAVP